MTSDPRKDSNLCWGKRGGSTQILSELDGISGRIRKLKGDRLGRRKFHVESKHVEANSDLAPQCRISPTSRLRQSITQPKGSFHLQVACRCGDRANVRKDGATRDCHAMWIYRFESLSEMF